MLVLALQFSRCDHVSWWQRVRNPSRDELDAVAPEGSNSLKTEEKTVTVAGMPIGRDEPYNLTVS